MQHGVIRHNLSSSQSDLLNQLNGIFNNVKAQSNYRSNPNFKYAPNDNSNRELDIWIQEYNLSFEFQDSYHYITTWYNQIPHHQVRENDQKKIDLAHKSGLTLVIVPCWWQGDTASLKETIKFSRPDIELASDHHFHSLSLSHCHSPIPLNPPVNYFHSHVIPGVDGELMLATFVPNVPLFFSTLDSSWWIGEKYDGVRFCWNPHAGLYTRQGRTLEVAEAIECALPTILLDGELWFGRGQFQSSQKITNHSDGVDWHFLRMISFDDPDCYIQNSKYERRYKLLMKEIAFNHPILHVAPRRQYTSEENIKKIIKEIIEDGGEGLIVQRKGSQYSNGKSNSLIKLKAAHADKEGIVVSITDNNAVEIKLPEGITFTVEAEDVSIPTPVVGSIVSFSYSSQSRRDIPIGPKIYRVRHDLVWDDVVSNYSSDVRFLDASFTEKPVGHWTIDNMRKVLESFARGRNLDPLLPQTWYSISAGEIQKLKGGNTILPKLEGGYITLLRQAFPEITFHQDQFSFYKNFWTDVRNRRKFFEKYAKTKQFDPNIADNWYLQSRDQIMAVKGIKGVLEYHNGSLSSALLDLFPDIGLQKSELFIKRDYWKEKANRRSFFEMYAKERNFDPLVAQHWHKQRRENLVIVEGASSVLKHHDNSISVALRELFPEIEFSSTSLLAASLWNDVNNRRKFFEKYADDNHFDFHDANAWYSQNQDIIIATPGAKQILYYYSNRVSTALAALFPDIGLDTKKFQHDTTWEDWRERRKFFEDFAHRNKFDPINPNNWYSQTRANIVNEKDGNKVLSYHNSRLSDALLDLFPEIGLISSYFQRINMWQERSFRRIFFEKYAKKNGFDFLNPHEWYRQPRGRIMSTKGAYSVVSYHGNRVGIAIQQLFPEMSSFEPSNIPF